MANSRNKGATFERDVAKMLFLELGITFKRDLRKYQEAAPRRPGARRSGVPV
jgi:hypothetical protein